MVTYPLYMVTYPPVHDDVPPCTGMSLSLLTYRWLPRLVAFVALGDDFNKKRLRSEGPEDPSDVSVYRLLPRAPKINK